MNHTYLKSLFYFFSFFISIHIYAQNITGKELLDLAIIYHDPYGKWNTFQGQLHVTMETPNNPNRDSEIYIDLPKEMFSLTATLEGNSRTYIIKKDSISFALNGNKNLTAKELEENKLIESRAKFLQNYYTYLYGLPMKLKDDGTIVHDKIQEKKFNGKSYWVLKVSYEESIGKDTWYFYFDKETYRMEVYQFYHNEEKNDGEYILLTKEEVINGIKMPKVRTWYTNKDKKLLGKDILKAPSK